MAEDEDAGRCEHDSQHRKRPALESVDEVVAEGRDHDLRDDDHKESQKEGDVQLDQAGEGLEREGAADAVRDEPADGAGEGIQAGWQDVAQEAEGSPALDHHGNPEFGSPGRQDPVGERAERGADHDRARGLGHVEPEDGDPEDSDVDGRELEVRRHPGPEQVERSAMALAKRDVLHASRLDRRHPLPVLALPDGYVFLYLFDRLHRLPPFEEPDPVCRQV